MQCSGLREGVVVNVKEDDVSKLQPLRVVHRYHGHRALLGGPAPGANGNVVLAQLAGNLLPTLVGSGDSPEGKAVKRVSATAGRLMKGARVSGWKQAIDQMAVAYPDSFDNYR